MPISNAQIEAAKILCDAGFDTTPERLLPNRHRQDEAIGFWITPADKPNPSCKWVSYYSLSEFVRAAKKYGKPQLISSGTIGFPQVPDSEKLKACRMYMYEQ